MNNRNLYITHESILDVDTESSVRNIFTRVRSNYTRHIHQLYRLYLFIRVSSSHQQDHLLLFLDFRGWSALLSFKSFETSLLCLLVCIVSSSVTMTNYVRIPLARSTFLCRQLGQQSILFPVCLQKSWSHYPLHVD